MKFVLSAFLSLMFLLCGCQDQIATEYDQKAGQLEQRIKKAECDKMSIQHRIDSAWQVAIAAMERDLPADTEPGTKANFLSLKAEHLIKMLPEYIPMKTDTRQLISSAARLDSALTLQFNVLRKEFEAYETDMRSFLREVESQKPELRKKYLTQLQQAQKEACKAQQ